MIVRSMQGDDEINAALNAAMGATLEALAEDGLISDDDANQFADRHVCFLATRDGWCARMLRRWFGKENASRVLVVKVMCVAAENEGEHDARVDEKS